MNESSSTEKLKTHIEVLKAPVCVSDVARVGEVLERDPELRARIDSHLQSRRQSYPQLLPERPLIATTKALGAIMPNQTLELTRLFLAAGALLWVPGATPALGPNG